MTADIFGSNLGDALWLTPLARNTDLTVRMRKGDKRAAATAPIFDGLAQVEFVDNPGNTLRTWNQKHVTQCILEAHGITGVPSIPKILLTEAEKIIAADSLKNIKNPIVFINGNSANGKSNPRAEYVRPPVVALQALVYHYKDKGFTPIQFGPAADFYDQDAFDPLDGCIHMRGLKVRELAACYWVIGKYIGGDTGDYHLMLAVDGHATCLVPPHSDSFGYRHWDLLYDKECWGDEPRRVNYLIHYEWAKAKDIYQ